MKCSIIRVPIYGAGNRIYGEEVWKKAKMSKDAGYSGTSGHGYFGSLNHYWSKKQKKQFFVTGQGNTVVFIKAKMFPHTKTIAEYNKHKSKCG